MSNTLFLAALAASSVIVHAADAPVKVEVIGVQADFVDCPMGKFNKVEKGSVVTLRLTAPAGKAFIKSDSSRDIVLGCNDGAGKALADAGIKMFFSELSEDGKTMVCTASTVAVTPDGVLQLVGDVPVKMAKGKVKQPAVPMDVKKGFKAKVAHYDVVVEDIGGGMSFDKTKTNVSFEFSGKGTVADVEFQSADGKKLPANRNMTSTSSMGSTTKATYTYAFDAKPEKVNVVVSVWQGEESVNVPVNVKVSLSGSVK